MMIIKMKLYIFLRSAVGGGADLVGDGDSAFAGERGGVVGFEAGDLAGGRLEAVARRLAVGGGLGGGIEALHSVAASRRRRSSVLEVTDAIDQAIRHLPARDSCMCHGCTHHNHAEHCSQKCNLEASHGN